MRKFILILLMVCAFLLLVLTGFVAAFSIEWYRCAETKSTPELLETFLPNDDIKIAQRVPCTFKVRTSWSLMPVNAICTLPKGIQEAKPVEIIPGNWHWGTRDWDIIVWIQPYRDDTFDEIPVELLFEGGPDGRASINGKIPAFKVTLDPVESQELAIAQEVPIAAKGMPFWIWYFTGGLILIGLILWRLLCRKINSELPKIPVWETTLNGIAELRRALKEKRTSPENAITKLTDVVRFYLEKQFYLRAERQTTAEFLGSLQKESGPLDVEQRRFLREFLSSADMIKFARVPANDAMFEDAAERAESLIRNTSIDPIQKEN